MEGPTLRVEFPSQQPLVRTKAPLETTSSEEKALEEPFSTRFPEPALVSVWVPEATAIGA